MLPPADYLVYLRISGRDKGYGAMPLSAIRQFLKFEAAGGIVLIFAAALGIVLANSPLEWLYDAILETPVTIRVGALNIDKALLLWINDGLMAVFFFLVGLEVKREFLEGELSSTSQALMPAIAAVGGMAVPALVYVLFNFDDPVKIRGWAIPAATDIAFALGILALIGSRVPLALKVFLTAVAIYDDIGAILIIALFYTENLSLLSLGLGFAGLVGLIVLNRAGVVRIAPYVLVGIFMWVCFLKSGIHATLDGILVAMAIPMRGKDPSQPSPLRHLEHTLHPWIAFMILPVFGFANAGVDFSDMSVAALLEPVSLGIAAGLFLGKQVGIMGFVGLAVMFGIAKLPAGATWLQIYGVSLLCGIGFTMSLFIGTLAFDDHLNLAGAVRIGVIGGSVLAAVLGYFVLSYAVRGNPREADFEAEAAH